MTRVIVHENLALSEREEVFFLAQVKKLDLSFSHANPFENNKDIIRELKHLREEKKQIILKGKLTQTELVLLEKSEKKKVGTEHKLFQELSSVKGVVESLIRSIKEEEKRKQEEEIELISELDKQSEKEERRKKALKEELEKLDEELLQEEDRVRKKSQDELRLAKEEVEVQEKSVLTLVKQIERLEGTPFSRYHFSLLKKKNKTELSLKILEKKKQHARIKEERLKAHLETLETLRKQGKRTYLSPLKQVLSLGLLKHSSVAKVSYQLQKTELAIKEEQEHAVRIKTEIEEAEMELKEIYDKIQKQEKESEKERQKRDQEIKKLEQKIQEEEKALAKKVKALGSIAYELEEMKVKIQELLTRKRDLNKVHIEQEKNSSLAVKKEMNIYLGFLAQCREHLEDFEKELKKQKIKMKGSYLLELKS